MADTSEELVPELAELLGQLLAELLAELDTLGLEVGLYSGNLPKQLLAWVGLAWVELLEAF